MNLLKVAAFCMSAMLIMGCGQQSNNEKPAEKAFSCDCKIGEATKVTGREWLGVKVTLPKRQPPEELKRIAQHVKAIERKKGNKNVAVSFMCETYPGLPASVGFVRPDSVIYLEQPRISYEEYEHILSKLKNDPRDIQSVWLYNEPMGGYSLRWILYKEKSAYYLASSMIGIHSNHEETVVVKIEDLANGEKKIVGDLPDNRTHIIIDAKGNAQAAMTLTPDLLVGVDNPDVDEPLSWTYIKDRVWYTPLEKLK